MNHDTRNIPARSAPTRTALVAAALILHSPFSILNSSASVPLRWTVETSRVQPAVFDVVRGETIDLEAAMQSYGKPLSMAGKPVFIFWQTNGMNAAWWSAPAQVRTASAIAGGAATTNVLAATFTPAMDPGAPTVAGFIGATGDIYRAAFTLRFRKGPGAVPNAIEQPPRVLDLARTVVINPPWPTQADFAATTTVMKAELKTYVDGQIEGAGLVTPQSVTNTVTNVVTKAYVEGLGINAGLTTNDVSGVVTNHVTSGYLAPASALASLASLQSLSSATQATLNAAKRYAEEQIDAAGHWVAEMNDDDVRPVGQPSYNDSENHWEWTVVHTSGRTREARSEEEGNICATNLFFTYNSFSRLSKMERFYAHRFPIARISDLTNAYTRAASDARYAPTSTAVTVASHSSQLSQLSQSVSSKADAATVSQLSQSVSGMQSSISTLNNGYTRLYNFATGATNANFSATNYPPTAAAAATRCHYQPEQGMDFSTVPASLQLNEYRDGAWRTVMDTRDWTVWYYRFKEIQLTNEIARLKAQNAVISNNLANAKAWANHTANGVENPMTDTLVVDRPNMWLMADYEWQKCVSGSNQCFVIRAKNVALSGGANTNGFLEICDAFGRPYMRVNKSSETFAEPVFSNITYSVEESAWYVVFGNAAKPTTGGANAEIVGNGTGKCILYAEDDPECPATITWPESADSHAGHWIMKAVPKPVGGVVPSKMFFGAEIKVAGKDYVEYVKEASFGAGIRVGNNVYEAVESGNTLIWTKRND